MELHKNAEFMFGEVEWYIVGTHNKCYFILFILNWQLAYFALHFA